MKRYEHPFEPIVFKQSELLILGTFPSVVSFENDFYYSHKQNQFWRLLGAIFEMPVQTRKERISLLKKHKIALWDIIASCERENSSDANLKNTELSDIPDFLASHPTIRHIAFTGKKAQQLYEKKFKNLQVDTYTLPSPSPAYAAMKFEEKLRLYKEFFQKLNLF